MLVVRSGRTNVQGWFKRIFAEHLLNNRLREDFGANEKACNANKTNENESVRTGQVELAKRCN